MSDALREALKKVKMLVLDVDGVLTKGEMIYDDSGRELKIFNVKDGLGVYILSKLGIPTILLSAGDSKILKRRARAIHAVEVISGILPKERGLERILKKYEVSADEICFVGDDLIDIGVMNKVGLPVAVRDAVDETVSAAVYVTTRDGGCGAVREVIDMIIDAKDLRNQRDIVLSEDKAAV